MSEKTAKCAFCERKFVDQFAAQQHARARHPGMGRRGKRRAAVERMSAQDAYELVESCDLPDGAHWAMLEELTGLEPADFAFMSDELA